MQQSTTYKPTISTVEIYNSEDTWLEFYALPWYAITSTTNINWMT